MPLPTEYFSDLIFALFSAMCEVNSAHEIPNNYVCFIRVEFSEKLHHMIDISPLFGTASFCHISAGSIKKIAHVEIFTLLQLHILASFQSRANSSFFRNISSSLLFFQDSKVCIFLCRKVNKIYFSHSIYSGIESVFKRYSIVYKKALPV